MVKRKSSLFIAAILSLVSFITITWLSCSKGDGSLQRCEGVICENGGYCHMDTVTKKPKCICPTGYEGANCATGSISKYIGTWDMTQIITGSDTSGFINDTSKFEVFVKRTATPTTFFIDNFADNKYYNEIVCTLDSANSFVFSIDTLSAYHMLFDNYKLTFGYGYITYNDSAIVGTFGVRHLTATSNWVNDTVQIRMYPHKN